MNAILFVLYVSVLGAVLAASAILGHARLRRRTAGWWGGVILALILLASAQISFQELPSRTVQVASGCSNQTVTITEWDTVFAESTRIDWFALCAGAVLALIAFELLERVAVIPEKVLAFIVLLLSFSSLFLLVYIFLLRKLSYIFFSATMGLLLSVSIHRAFVSKPDRSKWWTVLYRRCNGA